MCHVMWDIEFLQEALAIKTTCDSHMLRETCQSYMWVVLNFLPTGL
jgi:hypothetical protein